MASTNKETKEDQTCLLCANHEKTVRKKDHSDCEYTNCIGQLCINTIAIQNANKNIARLKRLKLKDFILPIVPEDKVRRPRKCTKCLLHNLNSKKVHNCPFLDCDENECGCSYENLVQKLKSERQNLIQPCDGVLPVLRKKNSKNI